MADDRQYISRPTVMKWSRGKRGECPRVLTCICACATGSPVIRLPNDIDPNAALLRPLLTRHRVATMFGERGPAHGLARSVRLFFVRVCTQADRLERQERLQVISFTPVSPSSHSPHSPLSSVMLTSPPHALYNQGKESTVL